MMDITITLSDEEVKCLENDLLDIEEWVQNAVKGKVSSCKQRMICEWTSRLMNDKDVSSIPTDEGHLIDLIVNRPDYKDRRKKEDKKPKNNLIG